MGRITLSFDAALMAVAIVVWAMVAFVWAGFMRVPEGTRVWASGALVFAVLFAVVALIEVIKVRSRGEP